MGEKVTYSTIDDQNEPYVTSFRKSKCPSSIESSCPTPRKTGGLPSVWRRRYGPEARGHFWTSMTSRRATTFQRRFARSSTAPMNWLPCLHRHLNEPGFGLRSPLSGGEENASWPSCKCNAARSRCDHRPRTARRLEHSR